MDSSSHTSRVVSWLDTCLSYATCGLCYPVAATPAAQTLLSLPVTLPSLPKNLSLSLASMVSQRCSSSGSSTYSSSSSAVEVEGWGRGAADRMVKIELEAAEALADLAHLATRESETGGLDSGGKWGSKGKRAMKRVKGESPAAAADGRFNAVDSALRCSTDHSQDQAVVDQQRHEDLYRNVIMKPIKAEQEADLLRPCSTSCSSFGGGRSRQNLTEAEKEARRIRRILANRESARQTIRRRQALCEELTKKATDLSWENENLKREKELALKQYQSLETTNRDLKARVAKAKRAEVEETQGDARSGQGDVPNSSPTNCPLLLYNRASFTPIFWPAMVHSSSAAQLQHEIQHPDSLPVPATSKPEMSDKQESLININGSRTPVYLLPCPWFFPLPDQGNGLHPLTLFGVNNKQDENSASKKNSACASSKNVANLEINSPAFSMKVRTEDSGTIEARPDLNESVVGCSQNGGGYNKRDHSKEMFLALSPAPCSSVRPAFTDKHADGSKSDFTATTEAISSTAIASSLPEQNQEQDMYPSKKLMDVVAAAEARRRRKELTKLKNLHGRQCRTHC